MARQVKQTAYEMGADVVGVAPVERFPGMPSPGSEEICGYAPSGYEPAAFVPGARSVIVFGVSQLSGVIEAAVSDVKTSYPFGTYGYVHLNRTLNEIAFRLARWLEARGWVTLPLGSMVAARFRAEDRDDPSKIAPLYGVFNMKQAAVLAGLGRRARNGLVANPVYGTHIRLGAVITTVPLEGDPILTGSPCPEACTICVDVCPMQAISTEGRVDHCKCFSDIGRRGRTHAEAQEQMLEKYPLDSPGVDYLTNDHASIDSFGNRYCKASCMTLCHLGENASPSVLRNVRGWENRNPPFSHLAGWLGESSTKPTP